MREFDNGLGEAFIAMKECNCLKPMWDTGRSLWIQDLKERCSRVAS
jgi:hypothetical protein